jgi:hypothetical protein
MMRILYTIGRPEPELEAIRRLIAERSGLDADEIYPYALSAGNDFGRVYYAVVEPATERGLIFTISRSLSADPTVAPQHLSEWEIKHLFKLARTLGLHKFTMLAPLRLFEDEIAERALKY